MRLQLLREEKLPAVLAPLAELVHLPPEVSLERLVRRDHDVELLELGHGLRLLRAVVEHDAQGALPREALDLGGPLEARSLRNFTSQDL